MKGFIEVHDHHDHKPILIGISTIVQVQEFSISTTATSFRVEEDYATIRKLIEAGEHPETRQNIYYRTSDTLPTKDDADCNGFVLVSNYGIAWHEQEQIDFVSKSWKYWAPVPKVEVKG